MSNHLAAERLALYAEIQRLTARLTELESLAQGPAVATRAPIIVPDSGSQTERLEVYLRQRPDGTATRKELARAFPRLNDNSLSGAISRLRDRGVIETVGRGTYRLRRRFS